jgi:hypothetical protein
MWRGIKEVRYVYAWRLSTVYVDIVYERERFFLCV